MLAVVLLARCEPGANEVNYDRMHLGMTRQRVVALIRQAPVAKVTDAGRFSTWFAVGPEMIRNKGELWRTGSRKLWVVFDKDQRVTGKMLEHDEADPVTELLRSADAGSRTPR